jgi:hypothetical protein
MATSYILWYSSATHKKDRFFVGSETVKVNCGSPTCQGHAVEKPSWTYAKDEATIFDGDDAYQQVLKAKFYCMSCGYKDLQIEPIDEPGQKLVEHDVLQVH